jgi:hypothetical protein
MKCPKCGFNSFEYYDSCKKCSSDLTGYKQTYSITSIVLPPEVIKMLAAESIEAESETDHISDSPETHDDIFSFDLPDDTLVATTVENDDPFNFNEPEPPSSMPTASNSDDDDVFANLLESTSQMDESPFAAAQPATAPAAAKIADLTSDPGEFDLSSFSWDDTPAVTPTPEAPEVTDDFDSLFGDMSDKISK